MIIIDAFKLAVMANYANFSGRANRSEYWYFVLANLIISIVLNIVAAILPDALGGLLIIVFSLAFLLPGIGAAVRRLHDINKSGWLLLLAFVPIVSLYLIYLLVQPSDVNANGYGEPSTHLY